MLKIVSLTKKTANAVFFVANTVGIRSATLPQAGKSLRYGPKPNRGRVSGPKYHCGLREGERLQSEKSGHNNAPPEGYSDGAGYGSFGSNSSEFWWEGPT